MEKWVTVGILLGDSTLCALPQFIINKTRYYYKFTQTKRDRDNNRKVMCHNGALGGSVKAMAVPRVVIIDRKR